MKIKGIERAVGRLFEEMLSSNMLLSEKDMVEIHMSKPWVSNFLAIAISPVDADASREYLGDVLFEDEGGRWYYPSLKWWRSHAKTSHPPEGKGCDKEAHVEYLTGEEFFYANIYKDGDYKILGARDFDRECRWWQENMSDG